MALRCRHSNLFSSDMERPAHAGEAYSKVGRMYDLETR